MCRLVVRILPPVNDKCIVPLGMKFGCHPKQVPHLLNIAKELELDVVGVRYVLATGFTDWKSREFHLCLGNVTKRRQWLGEEMCGV